MRWSTVFSYSAIITFIGSIFYTPANGGICWLHRSKDGICSSTYQLNMSQEQCCQVQLSYHPFTYWTPDNLQFSELVRAHAIYGGVPGCVSCRTSCKNVRCGPSKTCRMRGNQPRCICSPDCTPPVRFRRYRGKICGSDGQEYRNYCSLLKHNCRHRKSVSIAYFGSCKNSCKNVKCYGLGKRCLEDRTTLPHCVYCNQRCEGSVRNSRVLCDEYGNTHQSFCHLIAAACRLGQSIRLAYYGRCRGNATCNNTVCPVGKSCLTNPRDGSPVCYACNRLCDHAPSIRVCGTDNRSYKNYCQLSAQACSQGTFIKAKHAGNCQSRREGRQGVTWQPRRHRTADSIAGSDETKRGIL